jgi:hypothetical protein
MSDELEKFRQAKEWVETRTPGSQEWYAAYEHLVWTARETKDPGIRVECRAILERVLSKPLPVARNDK